jgi:cell division initiation protein
MTLTPLDIRKKEFDKSMRGYAPAEVRSYLDLVATSYHELAEERRMMKDRLQEMEQKLSHYARVEEALQEAVESARDNARRAQEAAEQRAKLIVEEAEMKAQRRVQDAEQERYRLRQDLVKLERRRVEAAAQLRGFLMSELEILAKFDGEEPTGFIKLLPSDRPMGQSQPLLKSTDKAGDDEPAEEPPADTSGEPTWKLQELVTGDAPAEKKAEGAQGASDEGKDDEDDKIRRILEDLDD